MPMYVMLSKLTDEGRETIHGRPRRITEVNQEVMKMGARVVEQWALLGPYDFLNLVEAPDVETIVRVSVALGARGTVEFLTMPALTIEQFTAAIRRGELAQG